MKKPVVEMGDTHPVVPRMRGTDELNLAEFPLAAITHRPSAGQKTLEFEDQIFDEGAKQVVQRRLVISGSDRFGLPTPLDTDVLLVLIQHTSAQNGFTQRTVTFSRYELVRFMGWDPGGKSYRRLDESLYKWAGATLYYHGAWWDKSIRRWRSKTFHILESLDLKGRGFGGGGADDAHSSFTWNEVIFESFQNNNIKSLNLDTYFGLKSAAARQAYRFLDKRFYRSRRLEFDLRVFACEHVGLGRNYDSAQLKRRLEPALKELEEIGFLQPMSAKERYDKKGRGEWGIVLVRSSVEQRQVPVDAKGFLAQELIDRGVFAAEARRLAKQCGEATIREKIALHDWLLKGLGHTRLENPPGFLAKAIGCNLPLPDDYKAYLQRESKKAKAMDRRSTTKVTESAMAEPGAGEILLLEQFLGRLTLAEKEQVEMAAVESASRFHAETYARLKQKGGELFDRFRTRLMCSHLQAQGLIPQA